MSDEVDQVVEAWARERGDLVLEPLHIWSRIDRLAGILATHRKRAFSAHHIEGWEFDVLAALRRAGRPYRLSPGQLLRETHVTSGTMTNRVDRLAARGWVSRQADPSDGRSVRVVLTDEGRAVVDAALGALLEAEESLLASFSAAERTQLTDQLRRLLIAQGDQA